MNWTEVLLEPFSYSFMQRALGMALLISCACAVFSCFLILKGWSLMGDAVSHAVLPGLAIAYLLKIPLAIGAFASGLVCALGTGLIKENSRIKEDAVMGILFSGMFALGLVMITMIQSDIHLLHVLFGNVLGIKSADLIESSIIAGISMIVMLGKKRDFLLFCFDPVQAQVSGLSTRFLHNLLLVMLSLTIVSSLKAAGIILVIAMLIAPGAIAFLLARTFDQMLSLSIGVAALSSLLGVFLSFHLDLATAPLIVLIQALLFLISFVYVGRPQNA